MAVYKAGQLEILDRFAAPLLVHEQAHVLERTYPERFTAFITQVLGFRALDTLPDAPWLAERRVVNPDGPDLRWAFKVGDPAHPRWIRPDLILGTLEHPRMPQDFRMVAVDLEDKQGALTVALDGQGLPLVEDLRGLKDYVAAFPTAEECYHPYEIVADLLAYVATGTVLSETDTRHPLCAKAAAWAKETLQ